MSKVAKNPEKYVTTFPFASVKAASIHKYLKSILLVWHFGIRVSFALPLGRSCGIYILVGICGYPLLSVTADSTTSTWPTCTAKFRTNAGAWLVISSTQQMPLRCDTWISWFFFCRCLETLHNNVKFACTRVIRLVTEVLDLFINIHNTYD